MPVRIPLSALVAATFALLVPSPALAAQAAPDQQAEAQAILLRPLTLLKIDDLDFGWLTVTTAGTAVLNPVTGAVTTTGGVLAAGGDPMPAQFVGAASRNTPVKIRIPNKPVTLTRQGGTETITLSNWTLDRPADLKTGPDRAFTFRVGGTLTLAAGQADGLYAGTFDVEVQYP
ncbi:MAG TPA: DUF4402 domain-containing protein [Sphingomicrobium sp.]